MKQTKWSRHEIGIILASLMLVVFLLIVPKIMGGTYYYQIREKFAGSVLDSGRVFLFTGADSTSTKQLTLSDDATAIDSVVDSILVTDTAACRLVYKLHFFGQGAEGFSENIPPMFPFVSGGAVDSNRTEQGGVGGGPYVLYYYVFDTTSGGMVPVRDVLVAVKNWGLTTTVRDGRTDVNGLVAFASNVDSLAALADAPLYKFPLTYDSTVNTGTLTDTLLGYLDVPPAAPGVNYVTIYLDGTGGLVDSATGDVIPRGRVEFTLILSCERGCNDGGWAIFPKTVKKTSSSTGRVSFTVMATTPLSPAGAYYILSYRAKDGSHTYRGAFPHFIVDTLVDPVNILDLTQTD